jgi:hypothetical protein
MKCEDCPVTDKCDDDYHKNRGECCFGDECVECLCMGGMTESCSVERQCQTVIGAGTAIAIMEEYE